MKSLKHFLLPGLIGLFFFNALSAQSTDRFIRIVGNASQEFKADQMAVYFTVTEIQPNEYRQIRYKPVEEVYGELVAELQKIGFGESSLEKDRSTAFAKYQKTRSESYQLAVNSQTELDRLAGIEVEGAIIKNVLYLFKNPGYEAEEEMALAAIKDARRKAERLATEVGKKLGKILNIDDKSSGCCREIKDSKGPVTTKTYKVNVTFELID